MKFAEPRPIKDYCLGIYDGPHATPKEAGDGPVFLGIKNITDDGALDLSEIRHVSEEEYPRWTRRVTPQAGDVVFTYEATLHRYAIVPDGFRGCLGRRVALVRPDPDQVDSRYLLYFFLSRGWRQVIESNVITGATVDRVPLERFPSFPAALPRLRIQQQIAEILSAYDDLIENNRRRMALLEDAARQLYREWFVRLRFPGHEHTRITNGVPEGWKQKTFGDVCQAVGGGTPPTSKPEYWDDGNIIWATPTDITRNSWLVLLDSEKKITNAGLKNSSAKMLPPDTILMTSRASVGFFGLIDKPACTNQGFINVLPNEPCTRMYLLHNLIDRVEEIRSHASGATYKEISKSRFKALVVVIPNVLLLREFQERVTEQLKQVRLLHTMNAKLAQARDLLLPRLMSGEITV